MSRIMENFLSNQWNLYGLQMACGSLMLMVLHNYLTIMGMCIIGLCVYLIAISQRILGIRYGMVFYETNKERLDRVIKEIKKLENKGDKDE